MTRQAVKQSYERGVDLDIKEMVIKHDMERHRRRMELMEQVNSMK